MYLMTERKILFIVEGEQDELKFLKRMIRTCYPLIKHEFYFSSYFGTSIGSLFFRLFTHRIAYEAEIEKWIDGRIL